MSVVDETIIQSKKELIEERLRFINEEEQKLRTIHANITYIEMTEDPEDRTKKVMPDDHSIGGEITDERRQKILDKATADLTALGL